jgi:formylmethanofuran dehydrogenase subunit E
MTAQAYDPDKKEDGAILSYSFEEFAECVKAFHGYAAPGVIVGGFMVDLAYKRLPGGNIFDALCETRKCLPDAIQLLTPCTLGNGWLTVINIGRYAFSLYDKETGTGVRVFIDPVKIERWSEIRNWFFKLKPKKEQDTSLLMMQIKEAGADICGVRTVRIADRFLERRRRKGIAICPRCGEAYPADDGPICGGCHEPLWSVCE